MKERQLVKKFYENRKEATILGDGKVGKQALLVVKEIEK